MLSSTHTVQVLKEDILIEPVALPDFFLSFFSGAMIILIAALYAGIYTWAEIAKKSALHYWAIAAYVCLLGVVGVFSRVNHLNGHWLILTIVMAIGYWWMPRLIWRLCVGTHANENKSLNLTTRENYDRITAPLGIGRLLEKNRHLGNGRIIRYFDHLDLRFDG